MSQATAAAKYANACMAFDLEVRTAGFAVRELRHQIRDVNGLSCPLSINDGNAMDIAVQRLFVKDHADKVSAALALKFQAENEWEEARSYSEQRNASQPK